MVYRAVIQAAKKDCETALLVVRNSIAITPLGTDVLRSLVGWQRRCEERSDWPGTKLNGETARVYHFSFNEEVCRVLSEVADGLFDWVQPGLPEDPCFLSRNDEPWLVTIAHERDAYFELAPDEHDQLLKTVPQLADLMVLEGNGGGLARLWK